MSETIALFIDGDNTSYKDIEIILEEVKNYGRIIISRVYGDWSKENMQNWLTSANKYGIIPIQCDRIKGKNSSDIKLCVDIMNSLYTRPNISLFYIITTDSDYRHVISEIKILDKKVHCIGCDNANESLKSICDLYTKIEVLRNNIIDSEEEETTKDLIKEKMIKKDSQKKCKKQISKRTINKFIKEIEILLENKQIINISVIKNHLSRKYQFDYREWGYSKMSDFISANFNYEFNIVRKDKGGIYLCN